MPPARQHHVPTQHDENAGNPGSGIQQPPGDDFAPDQRGQQDALRRHGVEDVVGGEVVGGVEPDREREPARDDVAEAEQPAHQHPEGQLRDRGRLAGNAAERHMYDTEDDGAGEPAAGQGRPGGQRPRRESLDGVRDEDTSEEDLLPVADAEPPDGEQREPGNECPGVAARERFDDPHPAGKVSDD